MRCHCKVLLGIAPRDCCDADNWELPVAERHVDLKMQYNPAVSYRNNTYPFTYLPQKPLSFNTTLEQDRLEYAAASHDLMAWGRWIAVSLERYRLSEAMRSLGLHHGGQYCLVPRGNGYEEHEDRKLLDPVKPRERMDWTEYKKWLYRSAAVIDARGFGELTHRMIECLGLGIPVIRPKLLVNTFNPLVAGWHYIDCGKDGTRLAESLERLREAGTRERVIANGLSWYDNNASPAAVRALVNRLLAQV